MSRHFSHHIGSDSKRILKKISQELQSLLLWKQQDELQREKE